MDDSATNPIQPTYYGLVETEQDANLLLDACFMGALHPVHRGPRHHELPLLVRSPCAFIYEENASDIQSWTDGIHWAPVGVCGGFHVEREPGNVNGLFKKTITVNVRGVHHLVAYHTAANALDETLKTPWQDSDLRIAMLRAELKSKLLVMYFLTWLYRRGRLTTCSVFRLRRGFSSSRMPSCSASI